MRFVWRTLIVKKLCLVLCFGVSFCYADMLGSISSAANSGQCIQSCDPGAVMKALQISSEKAKTMSKTTCQVSCTDQCFANKINNKSSSEDAALQCKDSLKKTFNLN